MSIREAARMGMVDQSSLHPRKVPSPNDISLDQDDSLFVSSVGNQVPEPVIEINNSPLGSESPAPNSPNPFQNPTPPTSVNPPVSTQPSAPSSVSSNPINPFQTSQPPNPFGSLFSGAASNETASTTNPLASSTVPSNPFAAVKASQPPQGSLQSSAPASPFALPKTTEAVEAPQKEDTQTAPPAETPNPFNQPPASSLFPSQSSSIFTNGVLPNSNMEKPAPNPFASVASATSVASKPSETPQETPFPDTAQPTPNPFAPAKSVFSPKETEETDSQNKSSTSIFAPTTSSPFNFSAPQTTSPAPQLSASIGPGISSTNDSPSIFESVKPPSFNGFSKPSLFAPSNDSQKKEDGQVATTPTFDFSKSVPAKPEPMPSLFQATSKGPSPFGPSEIFPSSKPLTPSEELPAKPSLGLATQDPKGEESATQSEHVFKKPFKSTSLNVKDKQTSTPQIETASSLAQEPNQPEEPLQLPGVSASKAPSPPGNFFHSFPPHLIHC